MCQKEDYMERGIMVENGRWGGSAARGGARDGEVVILLKLSTQRLQARIDEGCCKIWGGNNISVLNDVFSRKERKRGGAIKKKTEK